MRPCHSRPRELFEHRGLLGLWARRLKRHPADLLNADQHVHPSSVSSGAINDLVNGAVREGRLTELPRLEYRHAPGQSEQQEQSWLASPVLIRAVRFRVPN